MRAGGGKTQAMILGQAHHVLAQLQQVGAGFGDVLAHAGAHFHYALVQFHLHALFQDALAFGKQFRLNVGTQIARFRIDGLILFFDPQSKAGTHGYPLRI